MLHYHGTPLTPRHMLQRLAGKHFCVSFARPDDAEWCLAHGQSVMWDSGAFTAHTKKRPVDWDGFYRWLEPRLGHPHWAVIPDVIGGDVHQQRSMVKRWPFGPWHGAPVWHMALDIDYLLELADRWPRLCFGSSDKYWQVGSELWERRCDEAFNELAKRHGRLPWVHMLRGMSLCGGRWPFASVDSVAVAVNWRRDSACPEHMARRFDAVQCPVVWHSRPDQMELLA